uniref:Uncharacterized protein n=1 Tax=Caenorhabditis japonica TaxID=281687 RepID=A0A8R1I8U4_CAEJA
MFFCSGKKQTYDGDRDVDLVQPGGSKPRIGAGVGPMPNAAVKPLNDDFATGVPPPHIPLADKSDDRTLA